MPASPPGSRGSQVEVRNARSRAGVAVRRSSTFVNPEDRRSGWDGTLVVYNSYHPAMVRTRNGKMGYCPRKNTRTRRVRSTPIAGSELQCTPGTTKTLRSKRCSSAERSPSPAGQPKPRSQRTEDWTVCGPCDPVRRVCTRRGLGRAQTAIKRHARLSRDRFESVENPCKVGSLLRLEGPAFAHQGSEGRRVVRRVGGQFGPWE